MSKMGLIKVLYDRDPLEDPILISEDEIQRRGEEIFRHPIINIGGLGEPWTFKDIEADNVGSYKAISVYELLGCTVFIEKSFRPNVDTSSKESLVPREGLYAYPTKVIVSTNEDSKVLEGAVKYLINETDYNEYDGVNEK